MTTRVLSPDYISSLCKRVFPDRAAQRIKNVNILPSRQHEMIAFDLLWRKDDEDVFTPLIARRYVSTLSWWRADDLGKAQREMTLLNWLKSVNLPVPQVLAREFDIRGDTILFTRLPGKDWSMIGQPFPEAVSPYVERLAWILFLLHSKKPPNEVRSVIPRVTLPGAMANLAALAERVDVPELSRVVELTLPLAFDIEERAPVLLHGDYHFSNVLLDNEQISGVIDWEFAAFGDPRWDVANAYMQMVEFGAAGPAAQFLQAYLHFSGGKFEGPPIHNVVSSLQQWAVSEWLLKRRENQGDERLGFGLAVEMAALRDAHRRRAELALRWLDVPMN